MLVGITGDAGAAGTAGAAGACYASTELASPQLTERTDSARHDNLRETVCFEIVYRNGSHNVYNTVKCRTVLVP